MGSTIGGSGWQSQAHLIFPSVKTYEHGGMSLDGHDKQGSPASPYVGKVFFCAWEATS